MPLGEQALPVRSAEPALVKITTRFICRVRSCTASAMAELGTSGSCRPCRSRTSGGRWPRRCPPVLMVGRDHFDRLAQHGAAEILDRHLHGLDAVLAGQVGHHAGLVAQHADLDHVVRDLGLGGPGQRASAQAARVCLNACFMVVSSWGCDALWPSRVLPVVKNDGGKPARRPAMAGSAALCRTVGTTRVTPASGRRSPR